MARHTRMNDTSRLVGAALGILGLAGIQSVACVDPPDLVGGASTTASGSTTGGAGAGGAGGGAAAAGGGGTGASGGGAGGGLVCPGGTTLCGQSCVDTDLDPTSCGACGVTCSAGEVCSLGTCGVTCLGGTTKCGELCVETSLNPEHCGDCDIACALGEVCSLGVCGIACAGGTEKCAGFCIDTDLDPSNCGACGLSCPPGEVCSMGTCGLTCVGGTTNCGGVCTETDFDPANCGGCGVACGPGELCSLGTCGLSCVGGTTKCATTCVDTDLDATNCGGCGVTCAVSQSCAGGACTCPLGLTACGTSCIDPANDPLHCGNCATACNAGQACKLGVCGGCTTNAECGANQVCASGVCQAGPPTTGLRFWVDAGIGVVKSGANQVSSWNDQSGHGLDLSQATVSKQPIWNAAGGPNNKPYVAFPGSTDYMQTALDLTLNQPETVFLVVNQHSFVPSGGGGSSGGFLMDGYNYGSGFIYQAYGPPNLAPCAGCADYGVATGSELPLATWGLMSIRYNAGQSWLQVNQLPTHSGNLGAAAMQGVTLGCGAAFGAVGGSGGGDADVYFAEILIYDAALSSAEVAQVQAYLDGKYNLY